MKEWIRWDNFLWLIISSTAFFYYSNLSNRVPFSVYLFIFGGGCTFRADCRSCPVAFRCISKVCFSEGRNGSYFVSLSESRFGCSSTLSCGGGVRDVLCRGIFSKFLWFRCSRAPELVSTGNKRGATSALTVLLHLFFLIGSRIQTEFPGFNSSNILLVPYRHRTVFISPSWFLSLRPTLLWLCLARAGRASKFSPY